MPADAAGLVWLRLGGQGVHRGAIPTGGLAQLQDMHRQWPFFRTLLSNMDMVLAKSESGDRLALRLAGARCRACARRSFSRISEEWRDSVDALLAITRQTKLLESNPLLDRSIRNRFPYLDPLNHVQVELLKLHRAHAGNEKVLTGVQLTINGISAGLRNSG